MRGQALELDPVRAHGLVLVRLLLGTTTDKLKVSATAGHLIQFERKDVKDVNPPAGPPGIAICNPPYGERIGEEKEWIPLYRKLGEVFGTRWQGWRVFVFTSNDFLAKKIGLPVKSRVPFFNGKIPCHLWEFGTG